MKKIFTNLFIKFKNSIISIYNRIICYFQKRKENKQQKVVSNNKSKDDDLVVVDVKVKKIIIKK